MQWRGFELHPEVPAGGMPINRLFHQDDVAPFRDHIQTFASRFGLGRLSFSDHLPSTRAAMAATEYAREQGRLHAFKEAVMVEYWQGDLDLEHPVQLGRLARGAGLDAEATRDAMTNSRYVDRVDVLREEAASLGVTGIPTFFFGDADPVVGCEPFEALARAAQNAGARPRPHG